MKRSGVMAVASSGLLLFLLTQSGLCAEGAAVGTTFSQVQCEYLNIDWKKTYIKTLDMGFDIIRLGAYWSRIEKEEGVYDFRELDWQIREAKKKKDVKILLTVGMKAPRWPEFFIPDWAFGSRMPRSGSNVADSNLLTVNTLIFIRAVINRYKDEKTIYAWQVENEPLNRAGPKEWWISKDFLEKEIDLVREMDSGKRPIVLNTMTYPNTVLRIFSRLMYKKDPIYEVIDMAEIPALNIYPIIGHMVFDAGVCFRSAPGSRDSYFRKIINMAKKKNKNLWVTELQAEPWEPGRLVHVAEKAAITCWPESFMASFNELSSLGIGTIFLWGVEYWYHRQETFKDKYWVDAALNILQGRKIQKGSEQ